MDFNELLLVLTNFNNFFNFIYIQIHDVRVVNPLEMVTMVRDKASNT